MQEGRRVWAKGRAEVPGLETAQGLRKKASGLRLNGLGFKLCSNLGFRTQASRSRVEGLTWEEGFRA